MAVPVLARVKPPRMEMSVVLPAPRWAEQGEKIAQLYAEANLIKRCEIAELLEMQSKRSRSRLANLRPAGIAGWLVSASGTGSLTGLAITRRYYEGQGMGGLPSCTLNQRRCK